MMTEKLNKSYKGSLLYAILNTLFYFLIIIALYSQFIKNTDYNSKKISDETIKTVNIENEESFKHDLGSFINMLNYITSQKLTENQEKEQWYEISEENKLYFSKCFIDKEIFFKERKNILNNYNLKKISRLVQNVLDAEDKEISVLSFKYKDTQIMFPIKVGEIAR